MRTFIALPLPEEVKWRLTECQRALRPAAGEAVRWTRPEQLHLTLRFIGEIAEADVDPLSAALHEVACRSTPFSLRAHGLSAFPDARHPRVIWAGVGGDLADARSLQERILEVTRPWGVVEDRPFHAHLTLGRVVAGQSRAAARALEEAGRAGAEDFGSWKADAVELLRSDLAPGGARYSVLERVPLTGAG
jgi:2'-5' RNA ligase